MLLFDPLLFLYQTITRIDDINPIDPKRVIFLGKNSFQLIKSDESSRAIFPFEKREEQSFIQSFDKYLSQKPLTSAIIPPPLFHLING